MSDPHFSDDAPRDSWLDEYRRSVERLRGETAEELGGQPMQPEALSAIALALASLPLVALLLPTIPVEPKVWQVALALVAVWGTAFRIQSARYARFHTRWQGKVVALRIAATTPVPARPPLLSRR